VADSRGGSGLAVRVSVGGGKDGGMRCEVVAIGTELLLGQIVDTNSSWIGEQLASAGIDSLLQTKVGDNRARIVQALRDALNRADAVICCGGLGPTQDDITRECIAEVMGTTLERVPEMQTEIAAMFAARSRPMPESNLRQAERPIGARFIHNDRGTAPGLICPIASATDVSTSTSKVIYAVPGVPHEMQAMMTRVILPDLIERSGQRAVIASRVLRTWGSSESAVAEMVAPCLDALDLPGAPPATIAFLASGIEGIKVRVTAKAATEQAVQSVLSEQEQALRAILGDLVFGVDADTMESVTADLLLRHGLTLGLAESLTGGLASARLVGVPGASAWFKGSVVSYASEVKFDVLGVERGPVVSASAARQMALGAKQVLGSDVGLSITGVAGPDEQDGMPVGTVFVGVAIGGSEVESIELRLPGDRERVRQYATISALNSLRQRLLAM
jgi:nicotinamide-nucleotide amidase